MRRSKVLVLDSSERAALAVIRSLGSKGIEVVAGDSKGANMGFLSKYCSHRLLYPDPRENKKKFIDALLAHVKKENYDLLLPITDCTTFALSEFKEEFERYTRVAAPDYESALKVFDKATTIKIAAKHNIPHPKTVIPEDFSDVREAATIIKYPVVIKTRMKPLWVGNKAIILNVTASNFAYNKEDLINKYAQMLSKLNKFGVKDSLPIIQEYVYGEGYGVEALMWDLKVRAVFMHRRLREYPVTGGASTLRESVKNDHLLKLGIKMLRALNWKGVAMVEFKGNGDDVKLMEVNGRFWGSLPLAINADVDFPYLLYKQMLMEDGEPNNDTFNDYRIGLKQRWLIYGDLLWFVSQLSSGKRIISTLKDFVASLTVPDDIISFDDPAPLIGAIKTAFDKLLEVVRGRITIAGETKCM
jgi:predicted ATP-grasp superfamily ATP-dependent carboligase